MHELRLQGKRAEISRDDYLPPTGQKMVHHDREWAVQRPHLYTHGPKCGCDDLSKEGQDLRGEDGWGNGPLDRRGHLQQEGGQQVRASLFLHHHLHGGREGGGRGGGRRGREGDDGEGEVASFRGVVSLRGGLPLNTPHS